MQMTRKPVRGERRHVCQRARFFEEVRCARNYRHFLLAPELTLGLFIELDYLRICATDDKKRRSKHLREFFVTSQIWPSAARDHGPDFARQIGGHP